MHELFSLRKLTHKNLRFTFIIGFIILLLLSSCDLLSPPPDEDSQESLKGTVPVENLYTSEWVLVAYGNPENPIVVPKNIRITANFSTDGQLNGLSACNQYSAQFSATSEGNFSIQPEIISTRMACPEAQMQAESVYLNILPKTTNFRFVTNERLEIIYQDDNNESGTLTYVSAQADLEGTTWTLTAYGDAENLQLVSPGVVLTAYFGTDGKITGESGCNNFSSSFTLNGDQIFIQPIISTQMACANGMEMESNYLVMLNSASSYEILGRNLSITTQDNQVLIYSSISLPLETTLWTLVDINGTPLPTNVNVTLLMTPASEQEADIVSGHSGCNNYFGEYQLNEQELIISNLASQMMACDDPIMQLENDYLRMLETTRSYQITGTTLKLGTELGNLTYSADRTPLTGALWVLTAIGDAQNPEAPVEGSDFKAQFTRNPTALTGMLSGTTGCNEYASAFTANLTEIKINNPGSTGNKTCVPGLLDQEQLYYLALNNATQYQILGNTLMIPYDDGKQVLIFEGSQIGPIFNRPLASLDKTLWYLWSINDQPTLNGTNISAEFSINIEINSGVLQGSSGCNLYYATFGESMGMQSSLSSHQTCSQPSGVMEQEKIFIQTLNRAFGYWLTGDQLIVNTGLGSLTFRQTAPPQSKDQTHLLQANEWYLVSYNTTLSTPGDAGEPKITFNPDGFLVGFSGCNNFQGKYITNNDSIIINDLIQTEAACKNNVLADQEKTMLSVLSNVRTYYVIGQSLQILGPDGVLNFFAQPVNRPEQILPPTAKITAPTQANVKKNVHFSAAKSTAQVPIVSYRWDFGDGSRGNGIEVDHVYTKPGTYFIQMTVTDQRNYRDSDSMNIEIIVKGQPTSTPTIVPTQPPESTPEPTQPPEATPEPTQPPETTPEPTQPPEQIPPQAAIQGPANGFLGEPISFSAEGSQPGSSQIVSYLWSFGDGTSSGPGNEANIQTIYTHSGNYTVSVTVTDEAGLTSEASLNITLSSRLDTNVWMIDQILGNKLVPGTTITLQFLNGRIAGFSGCNSYNGTYQVEDNGDGTYNVKVMDLQSTKVSCPTSIMNQEQLFLHLLSFAESANIQVNLLNLLYPEGIDPQGKPYPAGVLQFYELGTSPPAK
jgi:heat shock protein HslJ